MQDTGEGPTSSEPAQPRAADSFLWRIGGALRTLRPHQWIKNVFVLAPVVFAKEVFAKDLLAHAAAAFVVFCLLAGSIYTINDIADVEADRVHPVKRFRPIASGRVPLGWARAFAIALVIFAIAAAASFSLGFFFVAGSYLALNLAYSAKLKRVAYLDVACIATGFVLRVIGGGLATNIQVSNYLLLCTALLALFLGFGKRRHELAVATSKASLQRAALEAYSRRGLDWALGLTALATIATYLSYTLDPRTRTFFHTDALWPSTGFVVLGVGRFLQLVRNRPKAESPTQEMLHDGPFVAVLLLWVALVMWVVYRLRPAGF
ncbi:MAG TPA: decaprenyl-phosphate phosphoribosyltransferase [Polyangiaceae bacterium]|jgi:4-hydroxybenzoate polyprenyltransferase